MIISFPIVFYSIFYFLLFLCTRYQIWKRQNVWDWLLRSRWKIESYLFNFRRELFALTWVVWNSSFIIIIGNRWWWSCRWNFWSVIIKLISWLYRSIFIISFILRCFIDKYFNLLFFQLNFFIFWSFLIKLFYIRQVYSLCRIFILLMSIFWNRLCQIYFFLILKFVKFRKLLVRLLMLEKVVVDMFFLFYFLFFFIFIIFYVLIFIFIFVVINYKYRFSICLRTVNILNLVRCSESLLMLFGNNLFNFFWFIFDWIFNRYMGFWTILFLVWFCS